MIAFYLGDLERSMSRSLRFRRLIFRKGSELGHVLLENTNRKSYMWSPIALSHFPLNGLERSMGRSFRL